MSFTVKKKHKMSKNLKRILLSQTDRAIKQLEGFEQSPRDTIREARISFKRARTVLRLLRKVLDKNKSRYYNSIYRDLGHALSTQRDAFIKEQVLLKFQDSGDNSNDLKASDEDKQAVHEVLNSLYTLRIEFTDQTFGNKDFSILRKTTSEFYKRIKQSQKNAEASNQDDEYHEWRKNIKHFYHLVSLMIPVHPNEYIPLKKELHTLIHLLGDDHDLTVLRKDLSNKKQTALLKKLANKQQILRQKAKKLGNNIFVKDSSKFVARMENNWKNFRSY